MFKIDDFHITRLDPILDFPRKRQHMHDARVGLARVRSVGRSTEQLLAFCDVRRCGARSTCPRYLESLLLSYPVLLISSFGVSVCCSEHADGWAGLGLNRNAGLAARPGEVRRRQPSSSKRNLNLVHLRSEWRLRRVPRLPEHQQRIHEGRSATRSRSRSRSP